MEAETINESSCRKFSKAWCKTWRAFAQRLSMSALFTFNGLVGIFHKAAFTPRAANRTRSFGLVVSLYSISLRLG
jgi:hypothetical protein